ncbi:hypothetical protein BDN67DRAFT_472171 [Paxillus ammoniavirescens]|nr:hypothetical protein BDN67DRAFT_472171 [Paxillus ammoniavirescens]
MIEIHADQATWFRIVLCLPTLNNWSQIQPADRGGGHVVLTEVQVLPGPTIEPPIGSRFKSCTAALRITNGGLADYTLCRLCVYISFIPKGPMSSCHHGELSRTAFEEFCSVSFNLGPSSQFLSKRLYPRAGSSSLGREIPCDIRQHCTTPQPRSSTPSRCMMRDVRVTWTRWIQILISPRDLCLSKEAGQTLL